MDVPADEPSGHQADVRSTSDPSPQSGHSADVRSTSDPSPLNFAEEHLAMMRIQQQLLEIPKAESTQPQVFYDPSNVDSLLKNNSVIFFDTEYSQTKPHKLAYIQVLFPKENIVCILTYQNNFMNFWKDFLHWLDGDVVAIGFYLLADLAVLWSNFEEPIDRGCCLMHKVLDLFLFFKFVHNGFQNKNSLEDWAKRILNWKMNKKYQKTDWFSTAISPEIENYLVTDVWVLHHLIEFVKECIPMYYYNTWTHKRHYYYNNIEVFLRNLLNDVESKHLRLNTVQFLKYMQ